MKSFFIITIMFAFNCSFAATESMARFDGKYQRVNMKAKILAPRYTNLDGAMHGNYFEDVTNDPLYSGLAEYSCPDHIDVGHKVSSSGKYSYVIVKNANTNNNYTIHELKDINHRESTHAVMKIVTLNQLRDSHKYISKDNLVYNREDGSMSITNETSIKRLKSGNIQLADKLRNYGFINRRVEWLTQEHYINCEYTPFAQLHTKFWLN